MLKFPRTSSASCNVHETCGRPNVLAGKGVKTSPMIDEGLTPSQMATQGLRPIQISTGNVSLLRQALDICMWNPHTCTEVLGSTYMY